MSNQYLLKLRKAYFNFEKEEYTKVINTRIGSEGGGGTILNHFSWNSSRITAFTMDETPHSVRGDVSPLDDHEARWSEKMENTNPPRVGGRVRLYSESQVHTVSRWEDAELQDGISPEESGGSSDGAPFRGRSQSAPAALWKAKKYGRQLRRMSDEFDTWLDRGDIRRASGSQKQPSRGWFSFIWGSREEEGRE
ncbi:hypothetical protein QTP70_027868 [Hemibagrus guttatus]|uniref:Uncharacterized protein n=1 Tax=Hemibagrus guttatus TaxID=175788 RepID=A0AAE0QLR6_9TELE|nr:hypothetical protein QTP70_027868 [Hemibagrus guttatus]KAK3555830.1 hypothetical protein QTP86_029039 [Hemibagrus guttatus]